MGKTGQYCRRRAVRRSRPSGGHWLWPTTPLHRAHLLPAAVDVLLATGEPADAAADELTELACRWPSTPACGPLPSTRAERSPWPRAPSAAATLRDARQSWTIQQAPYEAAHTRRLLGRACELLGDEDSVAAHRGPPRRQWRPCARPLWRHAPPRPEPCALTRAADGWFHRSTRAPAVPTATATVAS